MKLEMIKIAKDGREGWVDVATWDRIQMYQNSKQTPSILEFNLYLNENDYIRSIAIDYRPEEHPSIVVPRWEKIN